MKKFWVYGWLGLMLLPAHSWGEEKLSREQKVRNDRERFASDPTWIYNDFAAALEVAKSSDKPILAVMRCLPCEECVKLDDEMFGSDPKIQALREQFVCVRIVSNNGLDLNYFRIDTDQSFAAVIFSPDGKVLGRYGTRSHQTEWENDVSVEGFAATMQGALDLFKQGSSISPKIEGKQPTKLAVNFPEKLPALSSKYKSTLEEGPNLVKSCIHCHQVGEALRDVAWDKEGVLKEENLFVYPNPKILGVILDPRTRTSVRRIIPGSVVAKAGVLPGDEIIAMQGQAVISTADIQWVLDSVPASGGNVPVTLLRRGKEIDTQWDLEPSWRAKDDIAWRVSTWELRRIVLGGMVLKNPPGESSKKLQITHVGRFSPHDRALKAGLQAGDKIVSIAGKNAWQRETDIIWYLLQNHADGKPYEVVVEREGKEIRVNLTVQRT